MENILTIARREFTRFRSRFKGRARPIVTLVLASTLLISYLAFRLGAIRGRGLYRIGVSPDGPRIQDSRFNPVIATRSAGYSMLETGKIDVYIDGAKVVHGDEEKSLYATGALKLYLESLELARIGESYEMDRAFPLRVELNHFPLDLAREGEVILPSLMNPAMPFARVVTVSLYLFPVFLVSVFFVSGFMDEKIDRRIVILLSAPVTAFQIIAGKMLPYIGFALVSVIVITLILKGSLLLAMLIFIPVVLFIFSIYLMVPLVYRTFKDTTFISMLATTVITSYLVFPAMFSGISDLSYVSPLTLAVKMYGGDSFGLREYLTSTASMYTVFALSMYIGSRVLNEEYLMGFRPLHRKAAEAICLAMSRKHPYISVMLLSLFLIPIVYIVQLGTLAISFNLPIRYAVGTLLLMSVVVEEVAKSASIAVLLENEDVRTNRAIIILSFLSALGFLLGEKLLVFVSVSVVSESVLAAALLSAGKLWIPLLAHFIFTAIVCLFTKYFGVRRYLYAIIAGAIVHILYNLYVLGVIL